MAQERRKARVGYRAEKYGGCPKTKKKGEVATVPSRLSRTFRNLRLCMLKWPSRLDSGSGRGHRAQHGHSTGTAHHSACDERAPPPTHRHTVTVTPSHRHTVTPSHDTRRACVRRMVLRNPGRIFWDRNQVQAKGTWRRTSAARAFVRRGARCRCIGRPE